VSLSPPSTWGNDANIYVTPFRSVKPQNFPPAAGQIPRKHYTPIKIGVCEAKIVPKPVVRNRAHTIIHHHPYAKHPCPAVFPEPCLISQAFYGNDARGWPLGRTRLDLAAGWI
jgi:hypothetical protein